LQSSFSYNPVALVDKVPTELNLKNCIQNLCWPYNIEWIKRETQFDLDKAIDRLEIVNGLFRGARGNWQHYSID